jgi:hypothetical protein
VWVDVNEGCTVEGIDEIAVDEELMPDRQA